MIGGKFNDKISFIALFVAFLCATNGELNNTSSIALYYLPFALCAAALVVEFAVKGGLALSSYILWRLLVLISFISTVAYALDYASVFLAIKWWVLQSIVVVLIAVKCRESVERANSILKLFLATSVLNLFYAWLTVDMRALADGERMGTSALNVSWNANSLGMSAAFVVLLSTYYFFFRAEKRAKIHTIAYVAAVLWGMWIALLSGSRKSILIILLTIAIYQIFSSKKKVVRNFAIATLGLTLAGYLLFNVSFLYERVGYRFEGAYLFLSGASGGDKSSAIRSNMIQIGLDSFWEKPILGHGINCYRIIHESITGWAIYSHNNFIELLVGTGIIGFLAYYSYFIWFLLSKQIGGKENAYIKVFLLTVISCDYGMVSYYAPAVQYILALLISCALYNRRNENLSNLEIQTSSFAFEGYRGDGEGN